MKSLAIILTPLALSACVTHANYDECTMPDEMVGIYINGDCMANDGDRAPRPTPRPEPEPEPEKKIDLLDEPDSATDPEAWREWREALDKFIDRYGYNPHTAVIRDESPEPNQHEPSGEDEPEGERDEVDAEDVTRALRSWMWSLEGEDI